MLVVDDEEMVQHLLQQALEDFGCQVDVASNGREALQRLTVHTYDLILTDIHMPYMSGVDFVRRLRQQGNRTPVVVMDSYPDVFLESDVGTEALATLVKPFDLCEVRRVLQEAQRLLIMR